MTPAFRAVHGFALLATVAFLPYHGEAEACMCVRDPIVFIGPSGDGDAPLNARVRAEVTYGRYEPSRGHRFFVREYETGAEVVTTLRGPLPAKGMFGILELQPNALLKPRTRYEVALLKPGEHPETIVFGTFRTGTTSDKTPPRLTAFGNVKVGGLPRAPSTGPGGQYVVISSCGGDTPHVVIDRVTSTDPGRPDARLLYGVWLGDDAGRIDVSRPPTGLFRTHEDQLVIGASDLCMMDFPFPKAAYAWIGVAALDDAGNPSVPHRLRIDLQNPVPP